MRNENRYVEFKESTKSKTYLKTVSAFANYDGGKIYFGIRDDGSVCGVENIIKERLNIENQINDNIKPRPNYHIEVDDQNILVLEVICGEDKPYYYNNKAYKRNDTSTIEIERLELQRLILEGQNLNFEKSLL